MLYDSSAMIKTNALKLKQRDLAKRVRTHPVYLNAVLRGRARPSPDLALRIEQESDGAYTRMWLLYRDKTNGSQPKA